MDDLEFRRRVFANPNTTDKEVADIAAKNPDKAQLKNSLQQLDDELMKALKVQVPDNLAHKLIWEQKSEELKRHKRRTPWYIGLAASVALTIGVTGTVVMHGANVNIGEEALAHMRYAETEQSHSAVAVNMDLINAKLAGFGGTLVSSIGNVRVANYCHLNTIQSLHLILDTDQGPMSVFIMPQKRDQNVPDAFADNQYHGESWALQKASIMVVGEKGADLAPLMQKVKRSITFSA